MREPKHGLAIMIAGPEGKKKGADDEGDEVGALDSMKAFMAAVSDDDAEGALEEFRNLMDLCEGGGE